MHRARVFLLLVLLWQPAACSSEGLPRTPSDDSRQDPACIGSPYFPLAVGNSWTYSCSVEGELAFDKTVTIVAADEANGRCIFRAELKTGTDPTQLVSYLFTGPDGAILSSQDPGSREPTLVMPSEPSVGDRVGDLEVTGRASIDTPATGTVEALRLETFPFDEPGFSQEERWDWIGRFYAQGVGLVAESDGLGGECVLVQMRLADP